MPATTRGAAPTSSPPPSRECQHRIAEYGEQQVSSGRHQWYAGTTAVVALLVEDDDGPQWLLANLGDSRIYRFADDELEQVSVDHSVVQELVDAGTITERRRRHPPRAQRDHPRAGRSRRPPRPTTSCCRCRRSSGSCSAPTASAGMIDDEAIATILRETDDPRDAADRWSPPRSPPAAATTPPRWSSMWWDWSQTTPLRLRPPDGESRTEAGGPAVSEATTRSYRPGAWFGIFGDHATVLLPPTEKARSASSGSWSTSGAGFDEVLDALISSGLRELPGFVLVSEIEADTKVVIRGAGRASFTTDGETVELEGSCGDHLGRAVPHRRHHDASSSRSPRTTSRIERRRGPAARQRPGAGGPGRRPAVADDPRRRT